MLIRATAVFTVIVLMCLVPVAGLAMTPYSQNFESMTQSDPSALANDGWLVFGNVYNPQGGYLYGYGPFPAPNNGAAFCAIAAGEGGVEQGAQQVVVFSDYENADHANGNLIEANVFQEQNIGAGDTGKVWAFDFQAKLGNIAGASSAAAFIKTLDPNNGFALTNFVTVDMTSIPVTWAGYAVYLYVDASLVGQIFQFGFLNTATNYEASGIYYDNIDFGVLNAADAPEVPGFVGATLQHNFPNPFSPETWIGFAIDEPGRVDLTVFDLVGRRVATLRDEEFAVGAYGVTWDGNTDSGDPAPAGQYWYVLQTSTGRTARSMTLLR